MMWVVGIISIVLILVFIALVNGAEARWDAQQKRDEAEIIEWYGLKKTLKDNDLESD